ncbi:MAG: T9SS type A sorting domain-containing protein [Bacteroidota bacterium]|nr:T9SS type A sorting domain-containing protein [Bacteroidota bacterium]
MNSPVDSRSWIQLNVIFDYPSLSFCNYDGKVNIVFSDMTDGNSMWVDNSTGSVPRIIQKNSYYPSTILNDISSPTYIYSSGTSAPYQITLKKHDVTVSSSIASGWNMLSVPNIVHDFSKTAVWSGASSAASAYIPGVGYVEKNTLENRIGYWVSFPSSQTKDYAGFPLDSVNIPVVNVGNGWNIIGSISQDLQTSKIYSKPANIISSRFFGYNNGKIILDVNSTASCSPPQCSEEPSANPPGAPPQVILSSPANGTTGLSTTFTLSWNASSGATSYNLQVSSDPCFTTFVFNDTTITTTSKQIGPLSYSTTYYWRVKPKNNVATGIWSNRWNFTIRSAPYIDPCAPINELSAMDQFSITDNKGNKQSMYAHNGGRKLALGLNDFDMPPSPPKGIFDARFKSGKFIEILVPDQSKKIKPIKIKDAQYPISFSWIVKEDNKTTYWLITGKKEKISLLGSGNVSIDGLENGELSVEAQAAIPRPCEFYKAGEGELENSYTNIPAEYVLEQNHPNPFNPTTKIKFSIPEAGFVMLKVYDVLGREVAILVNEYKDAGYYDVTWDGANITSGVFFYKLAAGSFTSVKKMLLMR